MVRAGNLGAAAVFVVQYAEIVALQKHIVKFKERHRLLAFQACFYTVHCQHAVNRITGADVAQKGKIVNVLEPVPVVDHNRVVGAVAEFQKFAERFFQPLNVVLQGFFAQKRTQFVFARRVADAGGCAADQRKRLMPAFLEPAHHHQRNDMPDMQAVAGGIRTEITDGRFARFFALVKIGVETVLVGALIIKAAFQHQVKKFGFKFAHFPFPCYDEYKLLA